MYFSQDTLQDLKSADFSTFCRLKYPGKENPFIDREGFLAELVKNQTVIDLGFAGHLETIPEKIETGTWMHAKLHQSASKCIGIDISLDAVNLVKEKYGYSNVYRCDITSEELPEKILKGSWDWVVLGQVLEHLGNPVEFLSNLHTKLEKNTSRLVVTVPNGISYSNFFNLIIRNSEYINADHRFWFTPYTLAKVGVDAGFRPEKFLFGQNIKMKWWKKRLFRWRPVLGSKLIMVFSFH